MFVTNEQILLSAFTQKSEDIATQSTRHYTEPMSRSPIQKGHGMSDNTHTIPTLDDLRARREDIIALAEKRHAYNVRVFGSVARGEPDAHDVDILVTFEKDASLYDISGLRLDLIDLLGCDVDIVEDHDEMRERFRRRVMKDAIALWDSHAITLKTFNMR